VAQVERPAGSLDRWLGRAGRIPGTAAGVFWLFMGIVSAVAGPDPWTAQSTVPAILIAASAAGAAIAWRREDIGGIALIASGVGMAVSGTWQPSAAAMSLS
jgi:hypothetical protein